MARGDKVRTALLLLLFSPSIALAGAWPRDKGELFLSFSSEVSAHSQTRYATGTSLYAEYGLTHRLTIGFDGTLGPEGTPSEAHLFLRSPLGRPKQNAPLAISFGLGQKTTPNPWGTTTRQDTARVGISWGHGLPRGWLGVDISATRVLNSSLVVPGQSGTSYKADFTWGMKPSKRLMLIWQLQTGKAPDGPTYAKFAPSLIWKMPRGKGTPIEIGFVQGVTGDDSRNLKLGFWKVF